VSRRLAPQSHGLDQGGVGTGTGARLCGRFAMAFGNDYILGGRAFPHVATLPDLSIRQLVRSMPEKQRNFVHPRPNRTLLGGPSTHPLGTPAWVALSGSSVPCVWRLIQAVCLTGGCVDLPGIYYNVMVRRRLRAIVRYARQRRIQAVISEFSSGRPTVPSASNQQFARSKSSRSFMRSSLLLNWYASGQSGDQLPHEETGMAAAQSNSRWEGSVTFASVAANAARQRAPAALIGRQRAAPQLTR
jgi:hypothetical protein